MNDATACDPLAADPPPSDRLALHPAVAWRPVAGEIFLVTPDRAMHRVASPTGAAIVKALAGPGVERGDLIVQLTQRFTGHPSAIAADVDAFLASLTAAGILRTVPAAPHAPLSAP